MKKYKLFLFDIDGVIKLGDNLIDGSLELFDYINSIDGKSVFITNNSTKNLNDYVEYFKRKNFDVDETNFLTALTASVIYLKKHHQNDVIFTVGTKSLIKELKENDLNVVTEYRDDIDVVLIGYDNELTYSKIADACKILQTKDVIYLATNMDLRCPVEYGFIPDCGAITNIIKDATNKEPKFLGKPSPEIVYESIKNTKYKLDEVLVVGDRLYTDIACGINANVDTCVVFTGEAKLEDLETTIYKPTYKFNNIKELYEFIKKNI